MADYGAESQHEPVTFSQALLHHTKRLILIVALLPGPWSPAVAAEQIASIDNYVQRVCVNIVSGWFKNEFTSIGQWWLDHAERYRRSCKMGIWTQDSFTYKGDFYKFNNYSSKPKPLNCNLPGRPHPEIFQGGNSIDVREKRWRQDVTERARGNGRAGEVPFAINAFVICCETEAEALRATADKTGDVSEFQVGRSGSAGLKTKLIGIREQIADRILL
ncbi:putative Alkanesulfonate monooxygenase [Mycena alexandri]|uniref:Alkanesulfonate monooxygenase n=1 Tax=Mycena alexandri TaxID=1745969 RepID=A0AAD6XF01_9AGAR|nr:putative Alkanesulfonate monooxygenase [Mycena alexandri]